MSFIEFFQTIHWLAVGQIILIDILLGGDNAIIIGLACRNLAKEQRMQGILWGTAGAIILRVILIFFAMQLLNIQFLKVAGALLLVWIGMKLLLPDDSHEDIQGSDSIWGAVRTIIVADLVMSFDNVIAIAGAADQTDPAHQMFYVIFGLLVSVPIIVWGSTIVLKILDRFPLFVYVGAGLLGWIAGGMLLTDIWVKNTFFAGQDPSSALHYTTAVIGAVVVIIGGYFWARSKKSQAVENA